MEAEPYFGYFESMRPDGLYLFATIDAKGDFDRDPGLLRFRRYVDRTGIRVYIHAPVPNAPGPTVDPTTQPVTTRPATRPTTQPTTRSASSATRGAMAPATLPAMTPQEQEALAKAELMVERIARGFEVARDTELFLLTNPDAPPSAARLPELNAESDDEPTPE